MSLSPKPAACPRLGGGVSPWHNVPHPLCADELLCACDVPHCSTPTCTGKVCFVSKRKEDGTITQHRGCFSQHILENCHTPVTEQYGMRCCDSSMCNAELEIFLQGTGSPAWMRMCLGSISTSRVTKWDRDVPSWAVTH